MTDVQAQQIVVTTGRVQLVAPVPYSQQVLVTNRDATNSIFIGPSNVATVSGAEVKPGTSWSNSFVDLPPETSLYAICSAGTPRVDVSQIIAD